MTSEHEASVAAGLEEVMQHPRGRAYLAGVLLARGDAVAVLARTRNLIRGYEVLHAARDQQEALAQGQNAPGSTEAGARQAIAARPAGTDPARIEQAVGQAPGHSSDIEPGS